MKHYKITNYTIKDWAAGLLYLGAATLCGQVAIQDFILEDYVHVAFLTVGCIGWAVLYYRKHKEIQDKNPQD